MKGHDLYPLFLDIGGRVCVVVGGGRVAERKVRGLLRSHGQVKVVSPEVTKGLEKLEREGRIAVVRKSFEARDLDGAFLVFAATGRKDVNETVKAEAEKRRILVNVVDDPLLCDFFVPSTVRRRALTIAISTSGTSPLASKMIRREMERRCARVFGRYAEIVANFRRTVMKNVRDRAKRTEIKRRIEKKPISEVVEMGLRGLLRVLKGEI